jgi:8-oxo-dGTP diphosphatase
MILQTACIILYDRNKRLLLQQRTDDAQRMPGYWAFFGGQIEAGETARQAVLRESIEELNYSPISPQMIYQQDFVLGITRGHIQVFVDFFRGDKQNLKLGEGQGWGWFWPAETEKLHMIPHDRNVIDAAEKYLQAVTLEPVSNAED